MRNKICLVVSIIFLVSCFTPNIMLAASENSVSDSVFKLQDAYFQVGNRQPVHLIHGAIKRQDIWLGDEFRLWVIWILKKGAESPCPRQSEEKECVFKLEVLGKNLKGQNTVWENWKTPTRITEDFSWSVPGLIPREAALGKAIIRIRMIVRDKDLYSYEIPIEIN